jgi:sugar O-acyltransferase (sialic acid O-acetyltransferase NeuD family)
MSVMFGSRGCARDAGWLLHEAAAAVVLEAFVAADGAEEIGARIHGVPIIGEHECFTRYRDGAIDVYFGIGASTLRRAVQHKVAAALPQARYPSLLHPSLRYDRRDGATRIGAGVMICAGTTLTSEVVVGDFAHINLHCTVAHCAEIGAFATLSPGCHVSGGVQLGEGCFLGAGVVVAENVRIAAGAIVGAGATVVRDLEQAGTYVGTPARLLQR